MKRFATASRMIATLLGILFSASSLQAEIPTVLTDRIFKGSGTINLLKDMTGGELSSYLSSNGNLSLGIDLNEHSRGTESASSVGVAIQNISLMITTTAGTFSFSDIYTNTTAMIQAEGSNTADSYYTLFGRNGSSQITSSKGRFDVSAFDDLIKVQNVSVTGEILSASVNVTFLDTDTSGGGANEDFFDFSAGFEDFAVFSAADAKILEAANFGVSAAPSSVTYDSSTPESPPGAPLPPLPLIAALGVLALMCQSRRAKEARRE